ncbi:MAG: hybrid sensor histidine kinase/response regulator [Anaerolineae bacterium]|nr:hybrid sensor histidine kinase/response regulator [Anaerolineae bacterium]
MTKTQLQADVPTGMVVMIDDRGDPASVNALRDVLQRSPYEVRAASLNVKRLHEAVLAAQPDLILLVGASPAILHFCQQLKADEDPPLAITVLNAPPPPNWGGFDAGVDDFLVQPINEAELIARLALALRSRYTRRRLVRDNLGLERQLEAQNKELERALNKAKEFSVLKDSIVSTVSHELRTPLLQVKSAVSMLGEDFPPSTEGPGRLVNYAAQATARMESVVGNITQLAAAMNLKNEAFGVADAISQAIRQLKRGWESGKKVDRVRLFMPLELPTVMGDRSGIAQVLQQLIDNGLKFDPDGGYVDVHVQLRREGIRVTVRDYGIGIPADQLENIFQAFYQVDSGTTKKFGGVGVGLTIVRLILDGLGLTIEVRSAPGEGSEFSFVLPLAI